MSKTLDDVSYFGTKKKRLVSLVNTCALDLRTQVQNQTEDARVAVAKSPSTWPPMPWWARSALTEDDSREMSRFIQSLEAVASGIPACVAPDQEPALPYLQWPARPEWQRAPTT